MIIYVNIFSQLSQDLHQRSDATVPWDSTESLQTLKILPHMINSHQMIRHQYSRPFALTTNDMSVISF